MENVADSTYESDYEWEERQKEEWETGEIINPFTFLICANDNVRQCLAKIMPWVLKFKSLWKKGFADSLSYTRCFEKAKDVVQLQEYMKVFQELVFREAHELEKRYPADSVWQEKDNKNYK